MKKESQSAYSIVVALLLTKVVGVTLAGRDIWVFYFY